MPGAAHKILIADPNPQDAEELKAILGGLNYQIDIAIDDRDTLHKAAEFQPDLIVLEIAMLDRCGFDICRKLKDAPTTRKILILMIGVLSEFADVERAVEAGGDDFLSKPVNKVELLSRVRNLLKLRS